MDEEGRLLELDRRWNEAYPRRDLAALDEIIADDWACIDGAGRVIGKGELLERVASAPSFLDPYRFDETSLRVFGDAAVVTGRLSGEGRDEEGAFYVEQRYTRVYAERGGLWRCIATQVTVVRNERLSEAS